MRRHSSSGGEASNTSEIKPDVLHILASQDIAKSSDVLSDEAVDSKGASLDRFTGQHASGM